MDSQKRWSGAALTTFWVIQFVILPLHIGSTAGMVMEFAHDLGSIPPTWIVMLTFFSVCFLTLPVEITGYLYNFLHPWLFVGLQIFKTIFYSAGAGYAVYTFVHAPQVSSTFWSKFKYVGLSLNLTLLVTFWVALVYGSVVLHRYRKLGSQYVEVELEDKTRTREV